MSDETTPNVSDASLEPTPATEPQAEQAEQPEGDTNPDGPIAKTPYAILEHKANVRRLATMAMAMAREYLEAAALCEHTLLLAEKASAVERIGPNGKPQPSARAQLVHESRMEGARAGKSLNNLCVIAQDLIRTATRAPQIKDLKAVKPNTPASKLVLSAGR